MNRFKRKKYKNSSDIELLHLYKQKPTSRIIAEYYIRYGHLVFGVALKYLKNKSDAEDLTMTIFEKLPGKLIAHTIGNFKGWLYSVTKNECLMILRKKNKLSIGLEVNLQYIDTSKEVELKEKQFTTLERFISELKEDQKTCIQLFYIEQKSYQQISNQLRIPIKSVKSAIQNGKRNLKIKLEGNNEFKSTI